MTPREDHVEERFTDRDDLDQLHDETPLADADRRLARLVLGLAAAIAVALVAVGLALLARPDGQVVIERWPNGYARTETTFGTAEGGAEPRREGPFRAWHENGVLAEEGAYADDRRTGPWRFQDADGTLDPERSGVYVAGERTGPLPR